MCMCLYSYTQCAHVWVCVRLHVFIYVCAIPTTAGVGFFCCNFVYIYNFKYRHKVANRTSLRALTSAIRYWLIASSFALTAGEQLASSWRAAGEPMDSS